MSADQRDFKVVQNEEDQIDNDPTENEGPDPFDPSRYTLSQDFVETGGCSEILTTIKVKRFSKNTFFRVHPSPEFRANVGLLTVEEGLDREVYLIDNKIHTDLFEHVVPTTLYLAISRAKVLQLIPARLPGSTTGAGESWAKSLRDSLDIATEKWIKLIADKNGGFYRTYVAPGEFPDPVWPSEYVNIHALMKIAFRDRIISNHEHPIIRRLDGWE